MRKNLLSVEKKPFRGLRRTLFPDIIPIFDGGTSFVRVQYFTRGAVYKSEMILKTVRFSFLV